MTMAGCTCASGWVYGRVYLCQWKGAWQGVPVPVEGCMAGCLCNRKQFVSINGTNSYLLQILFGVPQGSILGPILFLIYINDLPKCTSLFSSLFADDTKLAASGPDLVPLMKYVNDEFQKVLYFFRSHKLSLHPAKIKFILFSNSNPPKEFKI